MVILQGATTLATCYAHLDRAIVSLHDVLLATGIHDLLGSALHSNTTTDQKQMAYVTLCQFSRIQQAMSQI